MSCLRLFFGTRSSCSMNSSGTPCTSVGGCSALCIKLSTSVSSKSLWLSSCEVPEPPRIISNAFAKFLKAAEMSRGRGRECVFCGCRSPDVSTRSRVEKKVLRSGRRRGCSGPSLGTLCSTAGEVSDLYVHRERSAAYHYSPTFSLSALCCHGFGDGLRSDKHLIARSPTFTCFH